MYPSGAETCKIDGENETRWVITLSGTTVFCSDVEIEWLSKLNFGLK